MSLIDQRLLNSIPQRLLGLFASVVPASPTNNNSESSSRLQTASDVLSCSLMSALIPHSNPVDLTSGSAGDDFSPVIGSLKVMTPLASFE